MSPRHLAHAAVALALVAQRALAQSPPNPPTLPDSGAAPGAVAASPVVSPTASDTSRVLIEFQNQSWLLTTVYAVRESGAVARIGQAGAGAKVRLLVPRSVVGGSTTIRIVAVPFGHRDGTSSDVFAVVPGSHLVATLEPAMKTLSVLAVLGTP